MMEHAKETNMKILIVEDDPDFAALLALLLKSDGYSVFHASDGPQAYRAVRQVLPDLITLDIHMPRESGALFYRKLRADADFRETPVVVITGLTRGKREVELTIKSFLEVRGTIPPADYVEKHEVSKRLLDTVARVLASRAASGEEAGAGSAR
jgi:CheY-like chemotaxis protein